MALYTRSEYAKFVGISKANVSTYIKRSKIFVDPETDKIDSLHPQNNDFQKQREAIALQKLSSEAPTKKEAPIKKSIEQQSQPKQVAKKPVLTGESVQSKYLLDLRKTEVEIIKKEVDIKLAEQKLSVLQGNTVPIDLIKTIISQYSKAMITNYKSFSEQMISDLCHENRISDPVRIKFLGKFKTALNATHSKATNDAKTQLKLVIGENLNKESMKNDNDDE